MSVINFGTKKITCKIVYYGPGMSGKTTNVKFLHTRTPPQLKGQLISLDTKDERTIFFDFMDLTLGRVYGYETAFQIYTVPGQEFYNTSRRLVLKGVDGIVFVADSDPARLRANAQSMRNLRENLADASISLSSVPLVLQINKRDIEGALPAHMIRQVLDPEHKLPVIEAEASKGIGVLETLKVVSREVLGRIQHSATIGSAHSNP